MVDPASSLDLISKDKIHHFFLFLPLITLFLLNANIWILIVYTVLLALAEVYIATLTSFSKQSASEIVNSSNSKKKLDIKDLYSSLQKKWWFIKDLWLFVLLMLVMCSTFIVTFILSIINIKNDYMSFIMLAHIFLGVFMCRLLDTINFISSLNNVKKVFKENAK